MQESTSFPSLLQVVLDTTDARRLAEFYRELLGYVYRPGDEPPPAGQPDEKGQDWLVLHHPSGNPRIAVQNVPEQRRSTWPEAEVPQQLHFDLLVESVEDFQQQHARVLGLGATLLYDRANDPQEPLRVYADPAGHPFCIFTWIKSAMP
jgi:Glyoxalase-like domain